MRAFRNVNLTLPGAMLSLPVSITGTSGEGSEPRAKVVGPEGQEVRQTYLDNDDKEVVYADTKRAFGDKIVTQEKIKEINAQCQITDLDIIEIAPLDSIDPRRRLKSYYVYPHKKNGNPKAFNMLFQALENVKGAAIVKWTPSTRQELLAIYPEGDTLVAVGLSFKENFKAPDEDVTGHTEVEASEAEVEMATKLLTAVMGTGEAVDTATDEAVELKKALINGEDVEIAEAPEVADTGADLLGALRASLDAVGEKV